MNIKKIFLIDALGAFISLIMLGFVLPYFQTSIGMPLKILFTLSFIAEFFALYSFSCYLLNSVHSKTLLRIIASLNFLYCLSSFGLIVYYFNVLTFLGVSYFILEKIIILTLVYFEFKWSKV